MREEKHEIATLTITKQTPKDDVIRIGEECDRCGHCCKYDSGIVIEDDIPRIAHFLEISEKEFREKYLDEIEKFNTKKFKIKREETGKPYGPCLFYEGKEGCLIHEAKPLHCKVGNCKEQGEELSIWFMLNHFVNPDDPESIRQYAVYLKTHGTIPGGRLDELVPDKKRLSRIMNFQIR